MGERSKSAVMASVVEGIESGRIPLTCADRFDKNPLVVLEDRMVIGDPRYRLSGPPDLSRFTVTSDGVPYGVLADGSCYYGDWPSDVPRTQVEFMAVRDSGEGHSSGILMCCCMSDVGEFVIDNAGVAPAWTKTSDPSGVQPRERFRVIGDGVIFPDYRYVTRRFQTGRTMADAIVEPPSGPPIIVKYFRDEGGPTGFNIVQVPNEHGDDFVGCGVDGDIPVAADRLNDTVAVLTTDRYGRRHRLTVCDKSGMVFQTDQFPVERSISPPVVLDFQRVAVRVGNDVCLFSRDRCTSFGTSYGDRPVRMHNGDVLFTVERERQRCLAVLRPGSGDIDRYVRATAVLDDRYLVNQSEGKLTFYEYGDFSELFQTRGHGVRQFMRTARGFRAAVMDATLGRDVLIDFWKGKARRLEAPWDSVDINLMAAVDDRLVGVGRFGDRWYVVDSQGKLGRPADRIWRLRVEDNLLCWDMLRNQEISSCLARAR